MAIDLRLPNITATTTGERMTQMQSYMYQLVMKLNWALNNLESGVESATAYLQQGNGSGGDMTNEKAQSTFNAIKSLIIKSADIVMAYEDHFNQRFSGEYVAKSDFGDFTEMKLQELDISPEAIRQCFTDVQTITTQMIPGIDSMVRDVTANIKTGLLEYDDDGYAIYGIEVGERKTDENGNEVFNKFARFTSDRLSFYDQNGNEVSYISDDKLYITNAHITGNLNLGGYILESSNGIAFKWAGRR